MTGKGLGVHFIIKAMDDNPEDDLGTSNFNDEKTISYVALLNCERRIDDNQEGQMIGLCLDRLQQRKAWRRGAGLTPFDIDEETQQKLDTLDHYKRGIIYVPQEAPSSRKIKFSEIHIEAFSLLRMGFQVRDTYTEKCNVSKQHEYDGTECTSDLRSLRLLSEMTNDMSAAIEFGREEHESLTLLLGVANGRLWIDVIPSEYKKIGLQCSNNTQCERVSKMFLHGSLHVRIYDHTIGHMGVLHGKSQHGRSCYKVVEVKFEDTKTLKWAIRRVDVNPS